MNFNNSKWDGDIHNEIRHVMAQALLWALINKSFVPQKQWFKTLKSFENNTKGA